MSRNEAEPKIPVALTIAGSDPSGGAGLQADLKTFHQRKVYGMSVVTLITVQNTRHCTQVEYLSGDLVAGQLNAVIKDIPPQAAKTGALGTEEVMERVAACAKKFKFPLVVDPVMVSKTGASLMEPSAVKRFKKKVLPLAFLVTPNLEEAVRLSGRSYEGRESLKYMAKAIRDLGSKNILIKGGHLDGDATDFLFTEDQWFPLTALRTDTRHTHGTGCTYSAAITAELAKGRSLLDAVGLAKAFITRAIQTHPGLGGGAGPVNHQAVI